MSMKKFKVTLHLMVDPLKGDKTVTRSYYVEAENEWKAYVKAEQMQSEDKIEVRHLSIFNYEAIIL